MIATIASAVLYGATFSLPVGSALAWVALVPFLVTLGRGSGWRAGALGGVWGLVAAYGVGDWMPHAVSHYWDQSVGLGFVVFVVVSVVTGGLEYAAFAAWYARHRPTPRATTPLFVAAAWVAAELARARLFGGNPWALAGHTQANVLPVVQIADLAGVFGVSFGIVAVNAALAQWWTARRTDARAAYGGLAVAGATVSLALAYGVVRLATWEAPATIGTRVGIVQGAPLVSGLWSPEHYGRNLDTYVSLTNRALEAERPALVVWPESALTFFLDDEPAYRSAIARALAGSDAQLLTGGPRVAPGAAGRHHNAAFLLASDARTLGVYDKRVLLPFGEYLPRGFVSLVRRDFGRVREFAPGFPGPPLSTAAGRAGVLVCNEAFYPDVAADRVREGAEYLVVLANDSWVGAAGFARMAAALASFRAVETRRDVVRASTWGPSWVTDAHGRTAGATALGVAATTSGMVDRRQGVTWYTQLGDVFAFACVAITLVGMWRRQGSGIVRGSTSHEHSPPNVGSSRPSAR